MPAVITQGPLINNHYPPNNAQRSSAQNVIAQIDYAMIWLGAGTLVDNGVMRVDMQGTFNSGGQLYQNLQVQVDGVAGASTVAHANVCHTLMTADPQNQVGVANKVISALNQSLDTACSYTVTGTIP